MPGITSSVSRNVYKFMVCDICILTHYSITLFQVKEAHYGGKPMKYLAGRLNIPIMYEIYQVGNREFGKKVLYYPPYEIDSI